MISRALICGDVCYESTHDGNSNDGTICFYVPCVPCVFFLEETLAEVDVSNYHCDRKKQTNTQTENIAFTILEQRNSVMSRTLLWNYASLAALNNSYVFPEVKIV